jgi:hypothetical protein
LSIRPDLVDDSDDDDGDGAAPPSGFFPSTVPPSTSDGVRGSGGSGDIGDDANGAGQGSREKELGIGGGSIESTNARLSGLTFDFSFNHPG